MKLLNSFVSAGVFLVVLTSISSANANTCEDIFRGPETIGEKYAREVQEAKLEANRIWFTLWNKETDQSKKFTLSNLAGAVQRQLITREAKEQILAWDGQSKISFFVVLTRPFLVPYVGDPAKTSVVLSSEEVMDFMSLPKDRTVTRDSPIGMFVKVDVHNHNELFPLLGSLSNIEKTRLWHVAEPAEK